MLQGVFSGWNLVGFSQLMTAVMKPLEWLITGAACLVVLMVDILCEKNIDVCNRLAKAHFLLRWPVLLLLILSIAVFGIYGAGYDGTAFLYTQF